MRFVNIIKSYVNKCDKLITRNERCDEKQEKNNIEYVYNRIIF